MSLEYYISHGITAALSRVGTRRVQFARRDVDRVEDEWRMPAADTLKVGDPHPDLTGCVIDELRVEGPFGESGRQVWMASALSLGDSRGTKPTKILNRGKRRTIEGGWDERAWRYLSWHAAWKACTAVASTDVITCTAHGFLNGQRVFFARLTGGTGITPQSSTSLGVGYYVIERTTDTFKVSLTVGGSAHDITANMTAGEVIAGEFALGAAHPTYPNMHLCELSTQDDNTDWGIADCTYRGVEEAKPYHRMITVNGQQFSSSEPIFIDATGGWVDLRYTNFHLPEIVVTDTYLGTGTLPTTSVPSFETPPNAPSITSLVLTGDMDKLTYNYPYGWTVVAAPHQATLNSLISAMVYQVVYRYIHPVMFR